MLKFLNELLFRLYAHKIIVFIATIFLTFVDVTIYIRYGFLRKSKLVTSSAVEI